MDGINVCMSLYKFVCETWTYLVTGTYLKNCPSLRFQMSEPAFAGRQTRRNTQALVAGNSDVMDPWKDDRLRDFIAINVQTRVRSFHLARGQPLAKPGVQNAQRCVQLLMLPRTEATCSGDADDCPLRRTFSRIFGISLLKHETHEKRDDSMGGVQPDFDRHRTEALFGTPLQRSTSRLVDDVSPPAAISAAEHIGIDEVLSGPPTAASLVPPPPLNLHESAQPTNQLETADASSAAEVGSVVPSDTFIERVVSPSTGATPSRSMPQTAGSATPADYRADLNFSCCSECVEAICQHYQQLLNKGVIADRFSQKELLFAHWVLLKNMDGQPLDAHSSVGRKEALSITIKSEYYNLLKVPRVEELPASPDALLPEASMAVPVDAPRSKRRRDDDDAAVQPSSTKTIVREALLQKKYSTRRATASTMSLPSDPAPPQHDTSLASTTIAEPQDMPISQEQPKGRRKTVVVVAPQEEEPAQPAAAHALKSKPVPSMTAADTAAAEDLARRLDPKTLARLAAQRQKEEDVALQQITGSTAVDPQLLLECAKAMRSSQSGSQPPVIRVPKGGISQHSTGGQSGPRKAGTNKKTVTVAASALPSPPQVFDERSVSLVVTTAAAMDADPLKQYTFAQQCLLLLAASRLMHPNIDASHRRVANSSSSSSALNYWTSE